MKKGGRWTDYGRTTGRGKWERRGRCVPDVWERRARCVGEKRTNIKIGSLVVNEETSVSAFAEAILLNNDGWEWGDTLLYVQVEQKVQTMGVTEEEVMPNKEKKHKAKAVWQKWESSTQKLVCNNKELIAEFRSDEHVRMVIERYRAIAKVDRKKRAVEQEDDWTGKKLEWGM